MERIRILVASPYPIMRRGIRAILDQAPDMMLAGEAVNGEEAVCQAKALMPHLLMLEAKLAVLRGVDAMQRLQDCGLLVPVLVVASEPDPDTVFRLLSAGAAGYLLWSEPAEVMLHALRGVAVGKKGWLSPLIAEMLARHTEPDVQSQVGRLTERETQVIHLVAQGMTDGEIALALFISPATVCSHVRSVLRKLRCTNRTEAAVWAAQHGLLRSAKEVGAVPGMPQVRALAHQDWGYRDHQD